MSLGSKRLKSAVESAKKWTQNLTATSKRRPSIPEMKKDICEIMCRIPLNRDIVGRCCRRVFPSEEKVLNNKICCHTGVKSVLSINCSSKLADEGYDVPCHYNREFGVE